MFSSDLAGLPRHLPFKQYDRWHRGLHDRIFVLQVQMDPHMWVITVAGTTAQVYLITVHVPKGTVDCTCPDTLAGCRTTQPYLWCKHVCFVLGRVAQVQATASAWCSRVLGAFELHTLEARLRQRWSPPPETTPGHPTGVASIAADVAADGDDCLVCFEALQPSSAGEKPVAPPCEVCRVQLHLDCLARWMHQQARCVVCRTPYSEASART